MNSYFIFTLIYLEIVYKLLTNTNFSNFAGVIFYSALIGVALSLISNLFKGKYLKVYVCLISFLMTVIYSISNILKKFYDMTFSLSTLGLADQVTDTTFIGETFSVIIRNLYIILLTFVPLIVAVILFVKKILPEKKFKVRQTLLILIISFLGFSLVLGTNEELYNLYSKKWDHAANVSKFGVMPSFMIDIRKKVTGFEEEVEVVMVEEESAEEVEIIEEPITYEPQILDIDFDVLKENTNNANLQMMDDYFKNESYTYKNEYTGLFEGKNLIYIMAESFDGFLVDPKLTPTLYSLIHDGFYFSNYYSPTNMSTIGGEFSLLTGLYPYVNELSAYWRKGTNEYPFGIGTIFNNLGYSTFAYHNNDYSYQDRDVYLKSIGFDNYLGCYNGLEEKGVGCRYFPESDDEMMMYTIDDYINEDKFMVYYATVSGHMSWSFKTNRMCIKHQDEVKDLDKIEIVKAYISANLDLEAGLTHLIERLREANKLDNTVIVLAADHHPYGFRNVAGYTEHELMSDLAGYEIEDTFETFANNLIIYNPEISNQTIEKVCNTVDVLPTVYNLFGIDYDSRLFTGRDILSTSPGLVYFVEVNWLSDVGKYKELSKQFITDYVMSKDDKDYYVERTTKTVNNRKLMAKYIMDYNYYKHFVNDSKIIEEIE